MPHSLQYEIQVNNLVLCSWHGELPLCWCQAIQYVLNIFAFTWQVSYKALAGLAVFLYLVHLAYILLQYCVAISCKLCVHNHSVTHHCAIATPLMNHI